MVRKWSVCGWPTVFAAMSEMTRSGASPKVSASKAGALSSMKSIWNRVTSGIGSVGNRSMPTTFALGDNFFTTCAQPPGATPRSTTARDPFTK